MNIKARERRWRGFSAVAVTATLLGAGLPEAGWSAERELAPLPLRLPIPGYIGTPPDLQYTAAMERPSDRPRPPFLAPKGVQNLALKKKVTCSDLKPLNGTPDMVTDGNKEAAEENVFEMRRGVQWVQIDLEQSSELFAVLVWHAHYAPVFFRAVVVQVSNDPEFKRDVTTLFNNDVSNSAGLGIGSNREYMETHEGRLIDAKGVKARYVRCTSRGSTASAFNDYTEVEVYGLPAKRS